MAGTDRHRVEFINAYINAALESSSDPDDAGNSRELDDGYELSEECKEKLERVAGEFYDAHWSKFYMENLDDAYRYKRSREMTLFEQAGYDAWMTQNGHGCGFDDGDWLEPNALELTAAAKAIGEITLYLGDDEMIYAV